LAGRLYLLNGPNLNLLGVREPHIYGRATLADVERECRAAAAKFGLDLTAYQTNAEHQMVDWLHEARAQAAGIVFNPAAFAYYSVPILDALKMIDCPIVEVHISNLHKREEEWRTHTLMTKAVTGMISGLGIHGYVLGVDHVGYLLSQT
jgi:3-dehydroquinate dehydratase-2